VPEIQVPEIVPSCHHTLAITPPALNLPLPNRWQHRLKRQAVSSLLNDRTSGRLFSVALALASTLIGAFGGPVGVKWAFTAVKRCDSGNAKQRSFPTRLRLSQPSKCKLKDLAGGIQPSSRTIASFDAQAGPSRPPANQRQWMEDAKERDCLRLEETKKEVARIQERTGNRPKFQLASLTEQKLGTGRLWKCDRKARGGRIWMRKLPTEKGFGPNLEGESKRLSV